MHNVENKYYILAIIVLVVICLYLTRLCIRKGKKYESLLEEHTEFRQMHYSRTSDTFSKIANYDKRISSLTASLKKERSISKRNLASPVVVNYTIKKVLQELGNHIVSPSPQINTRTWAIHDLNNVDFLSALKRKNFDWRKIANEASSEAVQYELTRQFEQAKKQDVTYQVNLGIGAIRKQVPKN